MEIHIKSHDTIHGLLKDEYRKFDVIVYTNSDLVRLPDRLHFIETHSKEMLHIPVDDVDFTGENQIAPSLEMVKKVLDWSLGREKLICCCHAGVSRSSATAFLIAAREWGPSTALSVLRPYKHCPNRMIVCFGSQVLDDPLVWETFVDWRKKTGSDPSEDGKWYCKPIKD